MRINTTNLLVLLTAASGSTATAICKRTCDGGLCDIQWVNVSADGVDDIAGKCGGLWDNLKRYPLCCGPMTTFCGGEDGKLVWKFRVDSPCNNDMIESTWWWATKNEFGSIDCDADLSAVAGIHGETVQDQA